ncbi:jg12701 [Pararge aegeria aegeria]|uniref:Jg12701 protein n=1 Tax=Pararge aegeria aegeria TaxID=348720 RepID=A0A8S4S0T4_9NEOP|nr:jg12701 [Pararge aegeria aegeria]
MDPNIASELTYLQTSTEYDSMRLQEAREGDVSENVFSVFLLSVLPRLTYAMLSPMTDSNGGDQGCMPLSGQLTILSVNG